MQSRSAAIRRWASSVVRSGNDMGSAIVNLSKGRADEKLFHSAVDKNDKMNNSILSPFGSAQGRPCHLVIGMLYFASRLLQRQHPRWPRREQRLQQRSPDLVGIDIGEGVAQFGQAAPAKQQLQEHQRRKAGVVMRIPDLGTEIGGV